MKSEGRIIAAVPQSRGLTGQQKDSVSAAIESLREAISENNELNRRIAELEVEMAATNSELEHAQDKLLEWEGGREGAFEDANKRLMARIAELEAQLSNRYELCDIPGMKRCVLVKGHGGSMCCSNSQTMWPKGMK